MHAELQHLRGPSQRGLLAALEGLSRKGFEPQPPAGPGRVPRGLLRDPTGRLIAIVDEGAARTDAAIIAASVGDPGHFGEIFERYVDRLFAYAARRAGIDAAEEIISEVFIQAFIYRERFDPAWTNAGPWLFGIATNVLSHHHRAERARLDAYARSVAMSPPSTVASPEELAEATAMLPVVARALRQLDARDRDTFLLFAWADLSYEQVAQALAIPVGTVRSRINRARRQLRELSGLSAVSTDMGREERS